MGSREGEEKVRGSGVPHLYDSMIIARFDMASGHPQCRRICLLNPLLHSGSDD
jgi:hypothetical protein